MIASYFDRPFRHWTIRDLGFPIPDAPPPAADDPCWVRYDNDCEKRKRATESLPKIDWQWRLLFDRIGAFDGDLEAITGVLPLMVDLYGAGLHVTDPGGWLQPHLDYNIHPRTGLERRVNLVLFLNREWKEEWGGAFELYDDAGRSLLKRIFPEYGMAVVWESGDFAFHGTQPTAIDAPPRVTAATYYLSMPRPGAAPRKRALFVPCRWRQEQRAADWEPPPDFS